MTARIKHVGPEESLMKSSPLQRLEGDARINKTSKPILSFSVDLKRQTGRSKCSCGVPVRSYSARDKREGLYDEPTHSKPSPPRPFDLTPLQLNCN